MSGKTLRVRLKYMLCFALLLSLGLTAGCAGPSLSDIVNSIMSEELARQSEETAYNLDDMLYTDIRDALAASDTATGYETYTVKSDSIEAKMHYTATGNFNKTESLSHSYELGKVTFVKSYINSHYTRQTSSTKIYQAFVETKKKGEPVVRLRMQLDPLIRDELKIKLDKAEYLYDITKLDKKAELEAAKADIYTASTVSEMLTRKLNYDNLLAEYTQYVSSTEATIASLKSDLEFYSQESFEFDLCMPFDGIAEIKRATDYIEGQCFEAGEPIATLYDLSDFTLNIKTYRLVLGKVNNQKTWGHMYYAPPLNLGDKITIMSPNSRENYSLTGTVIVSPYALYGVKVNEDDLPSFIWSSDLPKYPYLTEPKFVTVAFDDLETAVAKLDTVDLLTGSAGIDGTYKLAENVLVIPTTALTALPEEDADTPLGKVLVYNDDGVYSSVVTVAYYNSEKAWITSGLKEGDIIVANPPVNTSADSTATDIK